MESNSVTDVWDYDLFVIGAGSGGVRAARVAAQYGAKVGVAEEHRIGGTCVIRGCVPKKMLVYGAHFAEKLHDAARYGWTIDGARFDWNILRDTVNKDVDRLNTLYTQTLDNNGVQHFAERACVTGPHSVRLAGGRQISARLILIAVGAWPQLPDMDGVKHCITSNEVFHLADLPRRITIQGAGYIAMEFACIFHALGSEVTIVNRSDRILRSYDTAITDRLRSIMEARGIVFRLGHGITKIVSAAKGGAADGGYLVHTGDGHDHQADQILIATGRIAKTEGLGLEQAGIKLGARGQISVFDAAGRTSCPSIYAVGDVTDRVQLTPVAIREGQAFADALFGGKHVTVSHHHVPSAVFSQPPLASVGLTEAEARAHHADVHVYTADFRPMSNIFASSIERGLYKLVVEGVAGRVLGVHMIGPEAPEILQAVAIAVRAGLTKHDFDATIALHPSMAEELVLMK